MNVKTIDKTDESTETTQGAKLVELLQKHHDLQVIESAMIPQADGSCISLERVIVNGSIVVIIASDAQKAVVCDG